MDKELLDVIKRNPIVPVAVFTRVQDALKIAELLMEHSVTVLEVTMRTKEAEECIREVGKKFPEMTLGAGSVLDIDSLDRARGAGAVFGVAPCLDLKVLEHAKKKKITFVPGISTPSELNQALAFTSIIKIFPAAQLGGPDYIKSITAPFKMRDFYLIPTGGVNNKNYKEYLKVDRVLACGMTYMVDGKLIEGGDFTAISARLVEMSEGLAEL